MIPTVADRLKRLTLPVIAAPMFLVSGVELVVAACRSGIAGTFPSLNARTTEDFASWLASINSSLALPQAASAPTVAPYGVNLICHRTNRRLAADLEVTAAYKTPIVITSGGNPRPIVEVVHAYGGLVFSDVTDVYWARKAADAGVDGLILVCAGAGGHAGVQSPFALLPQVREFYSGQVILGGAISNGAAIRASEVLGADLVYVGTRFVATAESAAPERYKRMLVDSEANDIIYTAAFSGLPANMLRPSIRQFGLDPDNLPENKKLDISKELNVDVKAWRDIWTAGHGTGSIHDVPTVAELVARMREEYRASLHRPAWSVDQPGTALC